MVVVVKLNNNLLDQLEKCFKKMTKNKCRHNMNTFVFCIALGSPYDWIKWNCSTSMIKIIGCVESKVNCGIVFVKVLKLLWFCYVQSIYAGSSRLTFFWIKISSINWKICLRHRYLCQKTKVELLLIGTFVFDIAVGLPMIESNEIVVLEWHK
jgi:hypothetical protein